MSTNNDGDRGQATTTVRQPLNMIKLTQWMMRDHDLKSTMAFHPVGALLSEDDAAASLIDKIEIRQFGFGQSNPTYLIRIPEANFSAVLRKKPAKVAHASAHALHRDFRVLKALQLHNKRNPTIPAPVPHRMPTAKTKMSSAQSFI
jgi:hypothetical protein